MKDCQEEIGFVCSPATLALLYTESLIINELMNHSASQSSQSENRDVFVYFLQPLENKIDFEQIVSILDENLAEVFYFARKYNGDIVQNGEYQSDIDFGIIENNFIFPNI
jgi:hypothetical protein